MAEAQKKHRQKAMKDAMRRSMKEELRTWPLVLLIVLIMWGLGWAG